MPSQVQINSRLDEIARSFSPSTYSSSAFAEYFAKKTPKWSLTKVAFEEWLGARMEEGVIKVIGKGIGLALMLENSGEWIQSEVKNRHGKQDEKGIPRDEVRRLVREKWGGEPFGAGELIHLIEKLHPEKSPARVRSSVSPWVTNAVKSGELVVTTPGKKSGRLYRFRKPSDPPLGEKTPFKLVEDVVPAPEVAPILALPTPVDPTDHLVEAMCQWIDSSMKEMLATLQKTFVEKVARFEVLLREAKVASLEELVASMPEQPKLYQLVQEVKAAKHENGQVKSTLPFRLSNFNLIYESVFEEEYGKLPVRDQEAIKKGIQLLSCNGASHPSLKTKRIDSPLPNTPLGSFVSRSGDFRFSWRREGNTIYHYAIYRRGDMPTRYGSEQ